MSEQGQDTALAVFDAVPQDEREMRRDESIYGAVMAAAIADALGWVTEFMRSPQQLRDYYRIEKLTDFLTWEKKTGGRFNTYVDRIEAGSYSDDTQLTLCTARSLRPDGTFDADYFAKHELVAWPDYARGGGNTVLTAARMARRQSAGWDSNFFRYRVDDQVSDYRDAGANGVVMRIAPLVLANLDDPTSAEQAIWQNAVVTHGHPRAIVGALLYGRALQILASEAAPTFERFLSDLGDYLSRLGEVPIPEELQAWRRRWDADRPGAFDARFVATVTEMRSLLDLAAADRAAPVAEVLRKLGCFDRDTRGSGTASAAAALAIFLRSGGNLEHAIVKAVNQIGTDTDTIGSLVGGLVGAYCGYSAIPERWAVMLQDFDYFHVICDAISRINDRSVRSNGLEVDHSARATSAPEIVSVVQERTVRSGQRVYHRVLGPGWVHSTTAQPIRRHGGGTIVFARVIFDIGQSCVFHSRAGSVARQRGRSDGEASADDSEATPPRA